MKKAYFYLCLMGLLACSTPNQENVSVETFSPYRFETYEKESNDWGYRILNENHPFIDQPHIPSVPGNKGFASKEKAEITAKFIIHKLENGIMPPTINAFELDSLGVLIK